MFKEIIDAHHIFYLFKIYLFIWLHHILIVACGICPCGTQAPELWYMRAPKHSGLNAPQHVGFQFPNQGLNPNPLHCKADS